MAEQGAIRPVESDADIRMVVALGQRIWTAHYTSMLAPGQTAYMLEHFHSEATIRAEISEQGYAYFLISDGQVDVGYIGILNEGETLYLSKLYVLSSARGAGLGRRAMDFVTARARAAGCRAIRLGVNKMNTGTIAAYERLGFRITGEVLTEIGGGFVMDDYAMEKPL